MATEKPERVDGYEDWLAGEFSSGAPWDARDHWDTLYYLHSYVGWLSAAIGRELERIWETLDDLSARLELKDSAAASPSRDAWLYKAAFDADRTWAAIQSEFRLLCEEHGWRYIGSQVGMKRAAERHAKLNKLPPPPDRRNGI